MTTIDAPVIFLPGLQCDERVWMPVWQHMSLSQRAYVPLQWAESMEQMLALTQDRIDSVDSKVHLIGFSMGGYMASLSACSNPDKVASLQLIGYNPAGLSQQELTRRKTLLQSLKNAKSMPFSVTRLRQFLTAEELTDAAVINTLKDMEQDLGVAVLRAQVVATTPRKDMRSALQQLTLPIHFISAQHDQIAPCEPIKQFSQTLPNASYECIRHTAHMLPLTQPKPVAELLNANLSAASG